MQIVDISYVITWWSPSSWRADSTSRVGAISLKLLSYLTYPSLFHLQKCIKLMDGWFFQPNTWLCRKVFRRCFLKRFSICYKIVIQWSLHCLNCQPIIICPLCFLVFVFCVQHFLKPVPCSILLSLLATTEYFLISLFLNSFVP